MQQPKGNHAVRAPLGGRKDMLDDEEEGKNINKNLKKNL